MAPNGVATGRRVLGRVDSVDLMKVNDMGAGWVSEVGCVLKSRRRAMGATSVDNKGCKMMSVKVKQLLLYNVPYPGSS